MVSLVSETGKRNEHNNYLLVVAAAVCSKTVHLLVQKEYFSYLWKIFGEPGWQASTEKRHIVGMLAVSTRASNYPCMKTPGWFWSLACVGMLLVVHLQQVLWWTFEAACS